jgi:periplasmic divalent cation tolerance protein
MYLVVLTTFPDKKKAQKACDWLIRRKLAACVQYISGIESSYWWNGRIEKANECMCLIKTSEKKFSTLKKELVKLHPYQTPEIVAFKPEEIGDRYRVWLNEILK